MHGHGSLFTLPLPTNPHVFPFARQGSQAPLGAPSQGLTALDLGRTLLLQSDRMDRNEATGILGLKPSRVSMLAYSLLYKLLLGADRART